MGQNAPSGSPDTLWRVHDAVAAQIKYADAKAAVLLGADGILVTVGLPALLDQHDMLNEWWLIGLTAAAILLLCWSIYHAVRCLIPRLKPDEHGDAPPSLVFFEHIARDYRTAADYFSAADRCFSDMEDTRRQVADQIWSNAKVASAKFLHVKKAIAPLLAAIGIAIIMASILSIRGI